MTGRPAAPAGGRRQQREQLAVRIGQVAARPDLPDEDRLALLERDREGPRQRDVDPRGFDGRQRLEGRLERPGREPEQVLATDAGQRRLDRGGVGELQAVDLELRVVEGG